MKYCKECNAEYESGKFCLECGALLFDKEDEISLDTEADENATADAIACINEISEALERTCDEIPFYPFEYERHQNGKYKITALKYKDELMISLPEGVEYVAYVIIIAAFMLYCPCGKLYRYNAFFHNLSP